MRREPDFFGEQDLVLVYIAKRLKEALALEGMLTAGGLDYLVEPDHYTGGIIFRSSRVGAFFYVAAQSESMARALMREQGYKPYEPK